MDQRDSKKKKRRIPLDLRRRALISCDRCKKRRVRCLRAVSGSTQEESCQSCLENGVKCESTLPRKQRIYGSIETLSIRYRVLDALIKGLYPDNDTSDIDALYAIGEANNITLPTADSSVQSPIEDVFNQNHSSFKSPTPQSSNSNSFSQMQSNATPFTQSQPRFRNTGKTVEEKLIASPHGPSHYIGLSSSFGFALAIRNLVAEYTAGLKMIPPDDERRRLQSDFATLRTSKALEAYKEVERRPPIRGRMETSDQKGRRSEGRSPLHSPEPTSFVRRSTKNSLSSFLPTRAVSDALVQVYFDRVHPNYMVLDHASFYREYESTWTEDKRPIQEVDSGWVCVLYMVLVFGAQLLDHFDKEQPIDFQRRYLALIQPRIHQLISSSSLPNIQALLLLQLYQHNCRERNSSWMLLGCASRMAISLGMHREGATGGFDAREKEVRRRVWWTMHTFEHNISVILGRPSAIDNSEVSITLPEEATLDNGDCIPPGYIQFSAQLTNIMLDVKWRIYDAPEPLASDPLARGRSSRSSDANRLLQDLDSWYLSLPPSLQLECLPAAPKHRRAILLLHVQYHYIQAFVTRPFLLRKVTNQVDSRLEKTVRLPDLEQEELTLSHASGNFAKQTVMLLQQLAMSGLIDGVTWIDYYYLYQSVLILSLDFLGRSPGHKDSAEDIARKAAVRDVMVAVRNAKLCPLFAFLIQVALQFAKIVGVFDESLLDNQSQERLGERRGYQDSQPQQATVVPSEFKPQANVDEMINEWFQIDSLNLPLDFFGASSGSGYFETNMLHTFNQPMTGPFNPQLEGGVDGVISLEGSINPYGNWSHVDETFASSRTEGSSFSGSAV